MTCHYFNKYYNKRTFLLFADIFVFCFSSVRCFKFTPTSPFSACPFDTKRSELPLCITVYQEINSDCIVINVLVYVL